MRKLNQSLLVLVISVTCLSIIYNAIAAPVIAVKIDVGRKSKNCTGFGVCSVTIGTEFSERALGGPAEIGRDQMVVHLNRKLGSGNENTITADEPIKLRNAGREFTILAGDHKIERGKNTDTVYLRIK